MGLVRRFRAVIAGDWLSLRQGREGGLLLQVQARASDWASLGRCVEEELLVAGRRRDGGVNELFWRVIKFQWGLRFVAAVGESQIRPCWVAAFTSNDDE